MASLAELRQLRVHSPYVDFFLFNSAGLSYPLCGSRDSDGGERWGKAAPRRKSLRRLCKTIQARLHSTHTGQCSLPGLCRYSSLQKFGDLIKWIASRAKPTGRRITLHAQYKYTLEGVQVEDIGITAGQEFDGEIFDQDT